MDNTTYERLNVQIEQLRMTMVGLAMRRKTLLNSEVLHVSQLLDKLILQVQKEKITSGGAGPL